MVAHAQKHLFVLFLCYICCSILRGNPICIHIGLYVDLSTEIRDIKIFSKYFLKCLPYSCLQATGKDVVKDGTCAKVAVSIRY